MSAALLRLRMWFSLLAVGGFSLAPVSGVTKYEALFKDARDQFEGVYDQVEIERKLCEEELALGVEQNRWAKEVQQEGLAWLELSFAGLNTPETFTRVSQPMPRFARGTIDPWPEFARKVDEYRGATTQTNPACSWFAERIKLMSRVRRLAVHRMYELAIPLCEEAWLSAKQPKDLSFAVDALNLLRRIDRNQWSFVSNSLANLGPKQPNLLRISTTARLPEGQLLGVIEFWTLLSAPEPFLLPDPETEPAKFKTAIETWEGLRRIQHGVAFRPRIASHFTALNARYTANIAAERRELEDLIRSDVSAVDFEKALNRIAKKTSNSPPAYRPPMISPIQGGQFDYRALIARGQSARRAPPKASEFSAFSYWMSFKEAEEQGDAAKIELAAEEVKRLRAEFSPELAAFLEGRLGSKLKKKEEDAAVSKTPNDDAVSELIASLRDKPDSDQLVHAWEEVSEAKPTNSREASDIHAINATWTRLASQVSSGSLFDLRERATRQVLASVLGSPLRDELNKQPIATTLQAGLEHACADGSRTQILRLLAVDKAYCALDRETHSAYRSIVDHLPSETPDQTNDPEKARSYRKLLLQSTSPAAARYAAGQLKKLRKR